MSNNKLTLGIGKKFGKWKIVSNETVVRHNITHWQCECECGKQQYVPLNNLMNGSSTQCRGCSSKLGGLKRRKGYEDISGNHWAQLKSQAKRKGINFDIRIEEAWEIFKNQNEQCAFTGKKIEFSGYSHDLKKNTAILDLIEPSVGYEKYNCQWIHKDIGLLKPTNMGKKDFLELITNCFTYSNLKNNL